MNKTFLSNPADPEKRIVRLQLNEDEMAAFINDTGIPNPPVGFRAYIHCAGNLVEWGIEKIESGPGAVTPPKGGDMLDGKTVEELQTLCGRKSIKYTKEDSKVSLIQMLRAKP